MKRTMIVCDRCHNNCEERNYHSITFRQITVPEPQRLSEATDLQVGRILEVCLSCFSSFDEWLRLGGSELFPVQSSFLGRDPSKSQSTN